MTSTDELLAQPAVRDLISQGAREGRVSYAQINDLLVDLELDEDDVETLFATLEKRAITVSDEASAPSATPTTTSTAAPKSAPKKSRAKSDGAHSDLDDILAELDALEVNDDPFAVADAVAQIEADSDLESDSDLYAGEDLDDAQAPVADALKVYLNRMGQIPRLSPDEERELARVAHGADAEAALEAKNRLVESNLRLVVHLARGAAARTTLSITDLLQEGNLGLLDAVERYRAQSNKTFGSYATWWIRRSINRAIQENSRVLSLSSELYNAIQKMQTAQRELTQSLGRSPSRAEIAEATGLSVEQVEEAQRAASNPLSLDQPMGGDEDSGGFGETLFDPDAEIVADMAGRGDIKAALEKLVEDLPDRDRVIVSMRFGLGDYADSGARSADDVAQAMNLSRERVGEIETRALRKMRRRAKNAGLNDLLA